MSMELRASDAQEGPVRDRTLMVHMNSMTAALAVKAVGAMVGSAVAAAAAALAKATAAGEVEKAPEGMEMVAVEMVEKARATEVVARVVVMQAGEVKGLALGEAEVKDLSRL